MCESITMTADEYYQAYPEAERIDQINSAFRQLVTSNTVQVMIAPEDPTVGEVTTIYRMIPGVSLQKMIDM